MKKMIRTAAAMVLILLAGLTAKAQSPYTFNVTSQPYTPLTGAASVNNGQIWYDTSDFDIPIGFPFRIEQNTFQRFSLLSGNALMFRANNAVAGIAVLNADIEDRNVGKSTSASPVRYMVSGTAGARVFKMEVFNAGFSQEAAMNTSFDSISFQVWLYETSNIIELRFGGARVGHFNDYFNSRMLSGYIRSINLNTGTFDKFYLLNGNPAAPSQDSINSLSFTKGLTAYPTSGIVYRFVPKGTPTGVHRSTAANLGIIYPTLAKDHITIESRAAKSFELYEATGRLLRKDAVQQVVQRLDVSLLPAGQYYLRLLDEQQGADVHRFIIR